MQILDTPETEAKYQRLEALGKRLGIPILCGHLDLQVTQKRQDHISPETAKP